MVETDPLGWKQAGWRTTSLAAIPILVGFLLFSSTGRDDSHITYWAAHMLSSSGEIANYNGDRVEQSSSLTHVVLLAALDKILPVQLPTLGAIVSILCGGLTVILTHRLAALLCPRISVLAALVTAFSSSLIYWSFGGLETSLAASLGIGALLACAYCLSVDRHRYAVARLAVVVFLYLLVRPESIAVIASVLTGAALLVWCRARWSTHGPDPECRATARGLLGLLIVVVILFACIVLFRLSYFGSAFPQPVFAKSAGLTATALREGAAYLVRQVWTWHAILLWLVAGCGSAWAIYRAMTAPRLSVPEILVALYTVAYVAFIVMAGGDWMEGGRFVVPVLPMLVIMGLLFVQHVMPPLLVGAGVVLVCLQGAGTISLARDGSTGMPLWTAMSHESGLPADVSWFDRSSHVHGAYLRFLPTVDAAIQEALATRVNPVTFMGCQMGTTPYYLSLSHFGRIRFIDTCALVTKDFTECPVTSWLARNAFGLRLSLEFFFQHRRELRDRCQIGEPDVILEFNRTWTRADGRTVSAIEFLESHGYTAIRPPSGRTGIEAVIFVAVRNSLDAPVPR